MPRDPNNPNHIVAPVGLPAVAQTLGEARLDTDTLCCSDKINPYSLIRPLFRKSTASQDHPGTPPAWFANTANYNTMTEIVPAAKLAALQTDVLIRTSGLPCASEYDFGAAEYIYHDMMKWGYIVPSVSTPNAIFALQDVYWKRFYPADSARDSNGKPTECRGELQQFDGYIHAQRPVSPLRNIVLEYGRHITCTPEVNVGNYTTGAVLGGSDTAPAADHHPGGMVSVPAVLGVSTSYYYGLSVFRKSPGATKFTLLRHFIGKQVYPSGGSLPVFDAIGLGEQWGILASEGEYVVIPWVANKKPTMQSDNVGMTVQTGTRFYGFQFAEDPAGEYQGFWRATIVPKKLMLHSAVTLPGPSTPLITTSYDAATGKMTCQFTLYNNYRNYPLTARDFYVQYSYRDPSSNSQKDAGFGYRSADYNIPGTVLSPNSKTHLDASEISFQAGPYFTVENGTDRVTINIPTSTFIGGCKVVVNVTLQAGLPTAPTLSKLAFMSCDPNTDGGNLQLLSLAVVHTGTSGPAIFGDPQTGTGVIN